MRKPRPDWRTASGAFTLLLVVATSGVALDATPAQATTPDPRTESATAGFACWLEVDTALTLCVDEGVDLIAAVESETGIVLDLPEGATINGFSAPEATASRSASSARVSIPISVIYADAGYAGASYTLSSSNGSCNYGFTNLSSFGWHDRASSWHSYNGCSTALFEHENYAGTRVGYATNASALGAMNDKADSWRAQ